MSITSIKQAKDLLSQYAPPGESLAFINPSEAKALKKMGGSGEMTEAGIPTYIGGFIGDVFDDVGDFFEDAKDEITDWIPNELSQAATALGPMVALGNPWLGAAMMGLGSFDQTGSLTKGLKQGAKTLALSKGLRHLGGGQPFMEGWNPLTKGAWQPGGQWFTSPIGEQSGIGKWWSERPAAGATDVSDLASDPLGTTTTPSGNVYYTPEQLAAQQAEQAATTTLPSGDVYYTPEQLAALGKDAATPKFSWKEFWDAPLGTKWDMSKKWFAGLDPKVKWALGLGSVAAAFQYLENKANQKKQLKFEKGTLAYTPEYRTVEDINPTVQLSKNGGIIGLANGGQPTMEMDYRGGGFIPVGAQERADDVPARLSKNEFVMTADAVRAAGGGSVDVGAQRMYDLMNRLEAVA